MTEEQPVTIIVRFMVDSIEQALKVMESNHDVLERLTRAAKAGGAIHHAFYADRDPKQPSLVALDEWRSRKDFDTFFGDNAEIQDLLDQAGVRTPPIITVLETVDVAGAF